MTETKTGTMQVDTDLVRQLAELLDATQLTEIEVQDGERRIKVDAGCLDGGLLLGALLGLVLLRVVARQVAPGPHRGSCGIIA